MSTYYNLICHQCKSYQPFISNKIYKFISLHYYHNITIVNNKDTPIIYINCENESDEKVNYLLEHHWELVIIDEYGCETWSFPWELRNNWPPFIKDKYGTQHYWDRNEAIDLQQIIDKYVKEKLLILKSIA